jgi:hypothetical protein
VANDRRTVPTYGHEHHNPKEDPNETFRGRKDGPDIDVEKRQKELDRRAGHETKRSLAT